MCVVRWISNWRPFVVSGMSCSDDPPENTSDAIAVGLPEERHNACSTRSHSERIAWQMAHLYLRTDETHRVVCLWKLSRPSSDRYRWRLRWGGSCRDLGMPVQGTPERVTLWATCGRVLMQPQAVVAGEGAISEGGFRGQLGHSPRFHEGLSCRNFGRSRQAICIHKIPQ